MKRHYIIEVVKKTISIERIKYKIIHLLDPTLFPDIDLQCYIYYTLQE